MSTAQEDATTATITAFVNDALVRDGAPVDARTPLLELGLLDSLGLGSLLAFIRERFGVAVPDERVVPSAFMSAQSIARLVDELVRDGGFACIEPAPGGPVTTSHITPRAFALADGTEIHALEVAGPDPRWLLLPGLGEVASSWSAVLTSLATEHGALAIDYAGFGRSSGPLHTPTLRDHVGHALAVIEAWASDEPLVLVGCSAGSMIACELARRLGSRVRGLVVTGFGLLDDPESWWLALQRLADDPRAFLAAAFDRPVTLSTAALEGSLSRPAYRSFLGPDDRARLPALFEGLHVPVLVVGGQSDGIIPRDAFVRASEAIPGACLEWLARCGHFPHAEQADELVHLIRGFLSEAVA
ncbi:alpha/beta fold hydrolase [Paraliomyxa miuraensis]|uniref:alpha/beta fold hydrolase n=1 Tax=Paraliomyxa miuraensis TaxID=376150 RepID=UPI00224E45C0|nr:alpha/beta hydrolase [Paraliomyxa miuraensis]MCX4241012.1 alpha/beta hydrolase [Paraliomyxa miuraensis]